MSDSMFRCGDHEALVSYLYEDGDPLRRSLVRAHLAECARCAAEAQALGETRQQLMAWTPPEVELGVRVPSAAGAMASPAPRGRWWVQPLPAWAQVAAAGLIFAAGVSVGGRATGHAPVDPAVVPTVAEAGQAATTTADLAAIEERLNAAVDARVRAVVGREMAAVRAAAPRAATVAASDVEALRREIDARLARSEDRRLELAEDLQAVHLGLRTLEYQQMDVMEDLKVHRDAINAFGYLASLSAGGGSDRSAFGGRGYAEMRSNQRER